MDKPTKEQVMRVLMIQNALCDMEQSMDKKYHSPEFHNEQYEKFYNDEAERILKYWEE